MKDSLIGLKVKIKNYMVDDKYVNKEHYGTTCTVINTYNHPSKWNCFYFVCVSSKGECFIINQYNITVDMDSLKKIIKSKTEKEDKLNEIISRFEILDIREKEEDGKKLL